MIPAEIPINYARKELTQAQFQKRCNRLFTQKLVRFSDEEKKEIRKISKDIDADDGIYELTLFLANKVNNIENSVGKAINKALKRLPNNLNLIEGIINIYDRSAKHLEKVLKFFSELTNLHSSNPSIINIEKDLREMGLKVKFSENTSQDFALLVKKAATDMREKGYGIPPRVYISRVSSARACTFFGPIQESKAVFFSTNFSEKTEKTLKKEMERDYLDHRNSTNNAYHSIIHDFMHVEHSKQNLGEILIQGFLDSVKLSRSNPLLNEQEKLLLKREVSRYAIKREDGTEAVAEIGTGLIGGKTYPDEVMDIYKRFKGPIPKNN